MIATACVLLGHRDANMLTGGAAGQKETTAISAFLAQATTSIKRAPAKEQRLKMIDGCSVQSLQTTSC